MSKFILVLTSLCFFSMTAFGQYYSQPQSSQSSDYISVDNNGIYHNGAPISRQQLYKLLKTDPLAKKEKNKAKLNHLGQQIASLGLSVAVGYTASSVLSSLLSGIQPNWHTVGIFAGAGVGLYLITIPLKAGYNTHMVNAINIYNRNKQQTGLRKTPMDIRVGMVGSGVCIRMTF